jgi:hypothetical protein
MLCVSLIITTPASAHFSQIFSPFKAQLMAASTVAQVKTTCTGSYVDAISLNWLIAN